MKQIIDGARQERKITIENSVGIQLLEGIKSATNDGVYLGEK